MSVSRRGFLKSGALVSAAFVLKPASVAFAKNSQWSSDAQTSAGSKPFHAYSRELFDQYVGDTFHVRVGKQTVDLKLVALTVIEPGSKGITIGRTTETDCFSLRFHASKRLPATARTFQLNHAKLGDFDLFLGQSRDGSKFVQTAIVNHVI